MPEVEYPECGAVFSVVWQRTYEGDKPLHCPFCGEEMDYATSPVRGDQ